MRIYRLVRNHDTIYIDVDNICTFQVYDPPVKLADNVLLCINGSELGFFDEETIEGLLEFWSEDIDPCE